MHWHSAALALHDTGTSRQLALRMHWHSAESRHGFACSPFRWLVCCTSNYGKSMEKVAPYDCTIGLLSLLAGTESEQEKVRSEV